MRVTLPASVAARGVHVDAAERVCLDDGPALVPGLPARMKIAHVGANAADWQARVRAIPASSQLAVALEERA